jgi:hypothetical protein
VVEEAKESTWLKPPIKLSIRDIALDNSHKEKILFSLRKGEVT